MKIFSILTKLLRYFPEEISHFLALKGLKIVFNTGLLKLLVNYNIDPVSSETLLKSDKNLTKLDNLRSRLGIAAGLDKNEYIDCLAHLELDL